MLSASAQRVQSALQELGFSGRVMELPDTTRSAAEAAAAIGCEVAQIAKSLVFRKTQSDRPLLVIASGINRVNEKAISKLVGEKIAKADAEFVRQQTGFAIGGIPPVGHVNAIETLIDEDLLQYSEIWAAAGNPNAVFRLTPEELLQLTQASVVSVKSGIAE
jgi:prolyl-tRNA editing enzyme YbaK/EbsC (Cys-tRNA(Pro) deacylase)